MRRATSRTCASARPSAQMMALRSGLPRGSSGTQPIIWPENEMQATSFRACGARSSSSRVESHTARHQSFGSCSAHPCRSKRVSYPANALATRVPRSSYSEAVFPVVPRSWARTKRATSVAPVARIGDDAGSVLAGHDARGEAAFADAAVIVAGVGGEHGQEHERLRAGVDGAVAPVRRHVGRAAGPHPLNVHVAV